VQTKGAHQQGSIKVWKTKKKEGDSSNRDIPAQGERVSTRSKRNEATSDSPFKSREGKKEKRQLQYLSREQDTPEGRN